MKSDSRYPADVKIGDIVEFNRALGPLQVASVHVGYAEWSGQGRLLVFELAPMGGLGSLRFWLTRREFGSMRLT